MKDKLQDIALAAALALLLSFAGWGCASLNAPTLLDPGTVPEKFSDVQIFQFGNRLVKWWGVRSVRTEVFGTGMGIALDALTTGALASSGGGVSPDIVRGLVGGVAFISSVIRRIDPYTRDNAFNEGSGIVLEAQGVYLKCLTGRGDAQPSNDSVSGCGATHLAKINSAVKAVGSLMAGMMPQKTDRDIIDEK